MWHHSFFILQNVIAIHPIFGEIIQSCPKQLTDKRTLVMFLGLIFNRYSFWYSNSVSHILGTQRMVSSQPILIYPLFYIKVFWWKFSSFPLESFNLFNGFMSGCPVTPNPVKNNVFLFVQCSYTILYWFGVTVSHDCSKRQLLNFH